MWDAFDSGRNSITRTEIVVIPRDLYQLAYDKFPYDKRLMKDIVGLERHFKKGYIEIIRFDEVFIDELFGVKYIV